MNSRERLLAALKHEEPDYVPNNPRVAAWLPSHYGEGGYLSFIRFAEEFDADILVQPQLDIPNVVYTQVDQYNEFPDIRIDLSMKPDSRGITTCKRTIHTPAGRLYDVMIYPPAGGIYGMSPNPEKREYMIKDISDLEKLKYLLADPKLCDSVPPLGNYDGYVRKHYLYQIRPHYGADHIIVDSMGLENAMMAYYENKELLVRLVDICASYYRKCIERALDFRPDIIFDSWYNCSLSAGWSPAIWKELFLPHMKANRDLVHGAGAYYHFYDDGKITRILPELRELSPDILSTLCPLPVGDVDLAKVKTELGDKVCLNGYVDLQIMLRGTPQEVEDAVRTAIETAGPGGGFWLGTSDSIRNGSPLENVQAYCRAARKYGRYPLG